MIVLRSPKKSDLYFKAQQLEQQKIKHIFRLMPVGNGRKEWFLVYEEKTQPWYENTEQKKLF